MIAHFCECIFAIRNATDLEQGDMVKIVFFMDIFNTALSLLLNDTNRSDLVLPQTKVVPDVLVQGLVGDHYVLVWGFADMAGLCRV